MSEHFRTDMSDPIRSDTSDPLLTDMSAPFHTDMAVSTYICPKNDDLAYHSFLLHVAEIPEKTSFWHISPPDFFVWYGCPDFPKTLSG